MPRISFSSFVVIFTLRLSQSLSFLGSTILGTRMLSVSGMAMDAALEAKVQEIVQRLLIGAGVTFIDNCLLGLARRTMRIHLH